MSYFDSFQAAGEHQLEKLFPTKLKDNGDKSVTISLADDMALRPGVSPWQFPWSYPWTHESLTPTPQSSALYQFPPFAAIKTKSPQVSRTN